MAVIIYGDGGTDDNTVHTNYLPRPDRSAGGPGGGAIAVANMTLAQFKALGVGFDIHGGDGDNTLYGTFSRDTIWGKGGNDTLHGGEGDDDLCGGGADQFVFDWESETDTIHDFEDGQDIIVIKGGLRFSDLDIKQSGDAAVISDSSDSLSIMLEDFDASLLTADDFDFIA